MLSLIAYLLICMLDNFIDDIVFDIMTNDIILDILTDDIMLIIFADDIVKQKLISSDGSMGFGWTRPTTFSLKKWGFYPADALFFA